MRAPLLEVCGISKAFGGVQALADVSLSLHAGETLAVIGENGAGKSTLMKILGGIHRPDAGTVRIDGERVEFADPASSMRKGIALIHQELNLCENLTVSAALYLGKELRIGPFLRSAEMSARTRDALAPVGLDVDPEQPLEDLSQGQKQLLEIGRALLGNARILIMDEPTSSLTQQETDRLFDVVRALAGRGVGVIYISHRLAEVVEIADRVAALRDGRNAGELARGEIDHDRMVSLMVGRAIEAGIRAPVDPGAVLLDVRGLRTRRFPSAANDFSIRAGEVVGIAGLLGSGRSEILTALFGAEPAIGGSIAIAGRELRGHGPAEAARAGLVLVPEDRKVQGLVLEMNVRENLSLPTLRSRGVFVDSRYERDLARSSIERLSIATPGPEQALAALSGGNQQKVVLGKWLAAGPRVLMLDEPTRGIDVGARAEIYERLRDLARAGLGILFVSSELEEILKLADRVLVVHEGRIAGRLRAEEMTEEAIMALATGKGAA
ncbi:MAG: sugar ABC transporter ATP-binding protein [Planctomycetota bacterium]